MCVDASPLILECGVLSRAIAPATNLYSSSSGAESVFIYKSDSIMKETDGLTYCAVERNDGEAPACLGASVERDVLRHAHAR